MTFAVCDLAQRSEYLVTMVKVYSTGPKVFHDCLSLVKRQNDATCSGVNFALNLEYWV